MHTRNAVLASKCPLVAAITVLLLLFALPTTHAQNADDNQQALSNEQLEQLVAPIALHPDSLLSQILMASTYPLEVVQAARWSKTNPKIKGNELEGAMQQQPWDPSVKSLAAFPQVLQMMNDELGWTQQLGDAFLAQQEGVLAAVQRLRAKAEEAKTLKTTKQQKVKKENVTTSAGSTVTVMVF